MASRTKILPPPTFSLPTETDNFNKLDQNRYELWSVRIPQSVDVKSLDGISISLKELLSKQTKHNQKHPPKSSYSLPTIQIGDSKMALLQSHQADMENVRVLIPKSSKSNSNSIEDNNDDDDSDLHPKEQTMVPIDQPIQRHFQLISNYFQPSKSDGINNSSHLSPPPPPPPLHLSTETPYEGVVASSAPSAPSTSSTEDNRSIVETLKMKIAYSPRDQVDGLKRRWRPLGANTNVPWDPSLNQFKEPEQKKQKILKNTSTSQKKSDAKVDIVMTSPLSSRSNKESKSSEKKKSKKQKKEKKVKKEKKK